MFLLNIIQSTTCSQQPVCADNTCCCVGCDLVGLVVLDCQLQTDAPQVLARIATAYEMGECAAAHNSHHVWLSLISQVNGRDFYNAGSLTAVFLDTVPSATQNTLYDMHHDNDICTPCWLASLLYVVQMQTQPLGYS